MPAPAPAPPPAPSSPSDPDGVRLHLWGDKLVIVVPRERWEKGKELASQIFREPFSRRAWRELFFMLVGTPLVAVALVYVLITMVSGLFLAITFFGLAFMAFSVRGARGLGSYQRRLARAWIDEPIEDPPAFVSRPGYFGWLQSAIRDRTGWRVIGYFALKAPLALFGIVAAFSTWWDALVCLIHPFSNGGANAPPEFGFVKWIFQPGYFSVGTNGFLHGAFIFFTGVVLLFAAPWTVRGIVYLDRMLMRALLAPDAIALRVRDLEQARAQTVDASAATLRRIERDLHDGTQAQLVALAMRLGLAKEKLEAGDTDVDLAAVRELVDVAHSGAKEAIVELRDLARGIHPPALDVGLEGALATLAARSAIPTECTITLRDRPTPAIESIAYFCVAELLANVAQHAQASRASISATQSGQWLRLVVRDDGVGGAQPASVGTSSSGLPGLTDRVRGVDGQMHIASPIGGPTVITVDLPLHA